MSTTKDSLKIRLNVGGVLFKCFSSTLKRFPGSLLANLDKYDEYFDELENEFYFDRNPVLFNYIIDAYRTGNIHMPRDICGSKFKEEMEFWGLSDDDVSECCWETLYTADDNVRTIETLKNFYKATITISSSERLSRTRQRIWEFLYEPKTSSCAYMWSVFISIIIILSVIVSALETVHSIRKVNTSAAEVAAFHRAVVILKGKEGPNTTFFENFYMKSHSAVAHLDTFCFCVLTTELLLVIIFCPKRFQLLKSWLHLAEVVCSASYWFYFICLKNIEYIDSEHLLRALIVCKFLTIFKLVRLFRIARHISALKIMGLTVWVSKHEFNVLALMVFILISFFGFIVYVAEGMTNDTFNSMFSAMYWALVTLTTVGYGDIVPKSVGGQMIAGACAMCGVIMLALPVGIFASNFDNLYRHHLYVSTRMKMNSTFVKHSGDRMIENESDKSKIYHH